jgi:hypothetical protein
LVVPQNTRPSRASTPVRWEAQAGLFGTCGAGTHNGAIPVHVRDGDELGKCVGKGEMYGMSKEGGAGGICAMSGRGCMGV